MWASGVHDRRYDGRAWIEWQFDCQLSGLFTAEYEQNCAYVVSLIPFTQSDIQCDESTVTEIVAMTTQVPDQVFIVGMNGSGTTMLLDHLASHSLLFGFPAETQVLPYFIKRQTTYGDLADDANYWKLWSDLARSSYRRPMPGASEQLHTGKLARAAEERRGGIQRNHAAIRRRRGQANLVREDTDACASPCSVGAGVSHRQVIAHHSGWTRLRRVLSSSVEL